MPLIILCGAPKSGKSAVAKDLESFLLNHNKSVTVVQEAYFGDEKKSRSGILASVERLLTKDTFVIVDSTNHIKGFRYQLFCLARAVSTCHVVLFLSGRLGGEDWNEMETPNSQTRWDNPLFFIAPDDDNRQVFDELLQALLKEPAKKPSLATQIPEKITALTPEYLSSLERETSLILKQLSSQLQNTWMVIDGTKITKAFKSFGELQAAQRSFMHLIKAHPVPISEIRRLFIEYLNK
jgi:protein KTI12